jgi:serine/threonine-protein kinase HipA
MSELAILEVFLHEQLVGSITRLPNDSNMFTFDEGYVQNQDRPTLSLSFKSSRGDLKPFRGATQTKLPPFFSNLLPEGPMREYLAKQGGVKPEREFFLLKLLGSDLPGALIVKKAQAQPIYLIQTRIKPKDVQEKALEKQVFRFSLAGVQMKFSAIKEDHGGLTIPVNGTGGHWIIKLPSEKWNGVPENEYSMMQLARAAGLKVPEVMLVDTEEIEGLPKNIIHSQQFAHSLAVKRFDRGEGEERIHIEDMAQVFGFYPRDKYKGVSYENIAQLLWLEAGEESLLEYVRLLVFNLAIGNGDAHLKNWSLIYPGKKIPELAPAYDLVSTIAYINDPEMALSLSKTKNMFEISEKSFETFAKRAGLPVKLVVKTATEMAARFEEVWKTRANDLPMSDEVRKTVIKHKQQIPLFHDLGLTKARPKKTTTKDGLISTTE